MTRQQAINVMSKYTQTGIGIGKPVIEAHKMAISALQMQVGWVPVAERLPKTEDGYAYVMVCMDDDFVATTDYTECDGFSLWADSGEVIAWMPLPEPYKPD